MEKQILLRHLRDLPLRSRFARERFPGELPLLVCRHSSLIRRRLGSADMELQENKAVNLSLAAPKVDHILIRPGEIFSFWHLVGSPAAAGDQDGLVISPGKTGRGVGGGMCQFTNLIHWMALHSELAILEHRHHDGVGLFPDFGRVVPFGTGTSILYNCLDYRPLNETPAIWQPVTFTDGEVLHGELRCGRQPGKKYHIQCRNEFFSREEGGIYRNNEIWRVCAQPAAGEKTESLLKKNLAKIAYDPAGMNFSPGKRTGFTGTMRFGGSASSLPPGRKRKAC